MALSERHGRITLAVACRRQVTQEKKEQLDTSYINNDVRAIWKSTDPSTGKVGWVCTWSNGEEMTGHIPCDIN